MSEPAAFHHLAAGHFVTRLFLGGIEPFDPPLKLLQPPSPPASLIYSENSDAIRVWICLRVGRAPADFIPAGFCEFIELCSLLVAP